jgi:hypothetical protein
MFTDANLEFKQVWAGEVWRTHTFPKMTPVKQVAQKLQITEAPLRKALLRKQNSVAQFDIVRC